MASPRKAHRGSAEQALAAEEQAFRQQRAQLLRRYQGEYVALHEGRVVGHGPDDEELAGRLFADLGDRPFYIVKVEREPTVYELPSPELES
jgi:hypothetical protein